MDHVAYMGREKLVLDLSQESHTRLSFRKLDNSMAMSFSDNRIHFPITQALTGIHNSRPLVDILTLFLILPRLS